MSGRSRELPVDFGRRVFLTRTASVSGGLVLALALPRSISASRAPSAARSQLNAWLRIGADDSITVLVDLATKGVTPGLRATSCDGAAPGRR